MNSKLKYREKQATALVVVQVVNKQPDLQFLLLYYYVGHCRAYPSQVAKAQLKLPRSQGSEEYWELLSATEL